MRIVFMGTPAFAVPVLDALVNSRHEVVGVVTAADKLGGRGGKQLIESEVKHYAVASGLPLLQPERLRDEGFLAELAAWRADLQVVVAFRMLPRVVWSMPPRGTLNLHASLLPAYRGAAPINWAIINGEKITGVTTFLLRHEIDTGDILLQATTPIYEHDDAGTLHDRLQVMGAELVVQTVEGLAAGVLSPRPQEEASVSHAPKIFNEMCCIDFNRPALAVHNFVRGLSPYPTAWTLLHGQVLRVFKTKPVIEYYDEQVPPGTWSTDRRRYLRVSTADGWVELLEVQPAGRKRMGIADFLNGYSWPEEGEG